MMSLVYSDGAGEMTGAAVGVRHVAQKHSVTKHFEVIVGYLKYLMDKLTPRLDSVSKC